MSHQEVGGEAPSPEVLINRAVAMLLAHRTRSDAPPGFRPAAHRAIELLQVCACYKDMGMCT